MPQTSLSPDAALFAALLGASPTARRPPEPDLADLVLCLVQSVRRSTAALRDASACFAREPDGERLAALLAQAQAAALDQAECTAALVRGIHAEAEAA